MSRVDTLRLPRDLLDELHDYHPGVLKHARGGFALPMARRDVEATVALVNEVLNDERFSLEARDEALDFLRRALTSFGPMTSTNDDDGDPTYRPLLEDGGDNEDSVVGTAASFSDKLSVERMLSMDREIEDLRARVDELEDFRLRMNDLSDSLARIAAIPSITPASSQAPSPNRERPLLSEGSPEESRNSEDSILSYTKHSMLVNAGKDEDRRPVSILLPRQTRIAATPSSQERIPPSKSPAACEESKHTKLRPRKGPLASVEQPTATTIRSLRSATDPQPASTFQASPCSEAGHRLPAASLSTQLPRVRTVSGVVHPGLFSPALWLNSPSQLFSSAFSDAHATDRTTHYSTQRSLPLLDHSRPLPSFQTDNAEETEPWPNPIAIARLPPNAIPPERCTSWDCEHNPPPEAAASAPTSTRQRVLSWKARWTRERGDVRWARPESPPGAHSKDKRTRALVAKLEKLARY